MTTSTFNVAAQADRAAGAAASRAGLRVAEVEDMPALRAVSRLLEQVWGRGAEGVPIGSEVLRGLVHAGGAVTAAYDAGDGRLLGAAALVASPGAATYSLIAAAAPGEADRGVGYAVKLRQRAWALARGRTTMRWTFDPLVGRNGRFNLTKLGANAGEYLVGFYGRMSDAVNGVDESDRLVATWDLAGARAVAATERTGRDLAEPDPAAATVLAVGPDDAPAHLRDRSGVVWCRVPADVVALRAADPDLAAAWRTTVREALTDALAAGAVADGVTRTGWYRLAAPGAGPAPTSRDRGTTTTQEDA